MSFKLDRSIALTQLQDQLYSLPNDPDFWNFSASFGGWLAAVAANAVQHHSDFRGEILTQQMQFIRSVKCDTVYVKLHRHQQGRQIDFYQITFTNAPEDGRALAMAEIVAGQRADSDLAFCPEMPALKPIDQCAEMHASEMTPRWFAHYEQFLGHGRPFSKNPTPLTLAYLREADLRPLDTLSILAMVDTPMPRTFFVTDELRFGSTLSLSSHIYASAEEIASVGHDFVIIATDSATIRHSLLNQEVRLFRRDGLLLASSYQTAIFS
jgi:acyl-CoA thioesterase